MSQNINAVSPGFRDTMLMTNIGKYDMIDQLMIYPIGKMPQLYGNIKTKDTAPDGLFEYYKNKTKFDKSGELEHTEFVPSLVKRSNESIKIEYPESDNSRYSYTEDKQYSDYGKKNSWLSIVGDSIFGLLNGDNVTINSSEDNYFTSSKLENSTSLPYRVGEYLINGDSDLGKIGMKKLGVTFSNSLIQQTKNESNWLNWLKKPVVALEAIDQFDFESLKGFNLPGLNKGISNSILPLYMYSEIRKTDTMNFTWLNEGEYSFKGKDGNIYTDKVLENLINEDGQMLPVNEKSTSTQSLLYKTQKMFENGKIQTLVSKLSNIEKETNNTVTKGRSLWSKDGSQPIGNWTVTNQYNKISSLTRPFNEKDKTSLNKNLERVRPNNQTTASLEKYGVLQNDGFVKIAPYKTDKFGKTDVKKYMFSIENLAWKDSIDSIIENTSQEGPNGGRIMWFPPYDISFNETTSVNWNSETFIGRGEPVYTYSNTERNGTLNFKIIVDHPSIINYYNQDGYGSDGKKIENEDYLRFFAGKDVINLKTENEKIEENTVKKQTPPANPTKTAKFKIYFPNNYSGINDGYDDALKYLYYGTGCSITGGNGYENINGLSEGLNSPCNGKYYYRVDSYEELEGDQYKDLNCYGLNKIKPLGTDFYSFREFYEQIEISNIIGGNQPPYSDTNFFTISNGSFTSNNKPTEIEYSELFNILKNAKQISIMGSSSKQGNASDNSLLADNRMKIVELWLKKNNDSAKYTKTNIYKQQGEIVNNLDKDTNSKINKQERFVYVEITTGGESVDIFNSAKNIGYTPNNTQKKEEPQQSKSIRVKKSMYGCYVDKNKPNDDSLKLRNDESQFFEQISNSGDYNKSIIFEKLSEKIKYFSPAFHSMTPEGFNSRLTFLHQCTRQGPTLESKNGATNLAFGRPPICVLRIGDFYNTKVIFESVNIDYEPLIWDLNIEGIGVQPMLANVSMNFKFIGGSDLTGPIARLQNAITFNFFANTGVYDDRNDRITKHEYVQSENNGKSKKSYTDTYDTLYNPSVYDDK